MWICGANGFAHCLCREPERALEMFERARRLSPRDLSMFLWLPGGAIAHLLAGRPEQAIQWTDDALRLNPRHLISLLLRAAAEMAGGQDDAGRRSVERMRAINPALDIKICQQDVAVQICRRQGTYSLGPEGSRSARLTPWMSSASGTTWKSSYVRAKSAMHYIADITSPGTNIQTANSTRFALQVTRFHVCTVAPDAALNGCTFTFDAKVGPCGWLRRREVFYPQCASLRYLRRIAVGNEPCGRGALYLLYTPGAVGAVNWQPATHSRCAQECFRLGSNGYFTFPLATPIPSKQTCATRGKIDVIGPFEILADYPAHLRLYSPLPLRVC